MDKWVEEETYEEEKKKIQKAMENGEVIYDTEKLIIDERYRTKE